MTNVVTAGNDIMSGLAQALVIGSLILGILQCFFGFRLLRFWISFFGFVIGMYLGTTISAKIVANPAYAHWIIGVVCGLLLSLLGYKLYLAGVFVFCGILAISLVQKIPLPSGKYWIILLYVLMAAGFIGAGLLGVKFARPAVIFFTAGAGAAAAVQALASLQTNVAGNSHLQHIILLVMFIAGVGVQFLTTRKS
ncbi:MAG: hypothetical protein LIV24_06975 [Eubacterium sp.]|nr:hypothetical protein [Eubacterium sp.]